MCFDGTLASMTFIIHIEYVSHVAYFNIFSSFGSLARVHMGHILKTQ